MTKKKKGKGYVRHHITYDYDGVRHKQTGIVVPIFPAEHFLCTQLQRRGSLISKGFLKHLEFFIWRHKDSCQDLTSKMEKDDIKGGKEATCNKS